MIGLALEGGGIRGSYEAGVYEALIKCHVKIDGVCGTSIGALNGAMIASGKGHDLVNIWRNTEFGRVFGFSDNFIKALNSKEFNWDTLKGTIEGITDFFKNKGLNLDGIKKIVDDNIDVKALLNSPIDYGLCTVRMKDFKPMYLFKEEMKPDKIKDYILASSFLPIFKREKLIDNNYYLDGGFYDLGPVNMLLKKGYKKIYLVKIHGIGFHKPYDSKANVVIIEPKRSLGRVIEVNPKRIDENIKMGYYDTIKILKKLDGLNYCFKRRSEAYYKFINRFIDDDLYKRVAMFFNTDNYKDTTIKALEHIMESLHIDYYQVYNPMKIIKYIKNNYEKDFFIYKYLINLKYFW